MILTCTRRLQFCAGHRVLHHENKCGHLHGHNYVLFAHARADKLDAVGRIIDFGVIKERLGAWLDMSWDHGCILWRKDTLGIHAAQEFRPDQKLWIMDKNPTAENMASYVLRDVCPTLFATDPIQIYRIVLWETENCYATAEI